MGATEEQRQAYNPGDASRAAERAACLAEARRAGIDEGRIQSFLAANRGDECRISSALAPHVLLPSGADVVVPLFASAIVNPNPNVSPFGWVPPVGSVVLQAPASNQNPLSTVAANSVSTGPAVALPPAISYEPAAPATLFGFVSAPAASVPVAAPGGGAAAPVTTAAAAPSLDRRLLLVAAAVAAYLLYR